jgi:hypothetical protein
MPYKVWLRPNRRPAIAAATLCAAALVAAIGVVWAYLLRESPPSLIVAAAAIVGLIAALVGVAVAVRAARPRIWRQEGEVLFRLRTDQPIAVPLAIVEAFFLGQGPAHLPGGTDEQFESVNLVARLSERATQWRSQNVDPKLGAWCDGYITVRGTYCEPLNIDLVQRLNRELVEAKREPATG